jgi:hypothetical protein
MATAQHRRTRSYRGRHRKPAQGQRVVVPIVTLAALSVGGVAVAAEVGGSSHPPVPAAGALVPHLPSAIRPSLPPTLVTPAPHARDKTSSTPVRHARPDSLRIVDVSGPCYVQVSTAHGKVLVRRIMHEGDAVAFRRHGLDVTLGSAGAVRLAVDGHHARRVGRPGQVRIFHVA